MYDIILILNCARNLPWFFRIHHFEQRLHALFYKKKFNERIRETKPKIEGKKTLIIRVVPCFSPHRLIVP